MIEVNENKLKRVIEQLWLEGDCCAPVDRCFQDQGKCHECCLVKGNLDEVEKAMIDWLKEDEE